jgi:hypothetical protein
VREEVRVLVGDPVLVGRVADSVSTVWRYSSGVAAFAPEDRPTPEQIDAVVADLGRVVCAGLGDDVAWSVVQHGRAGSESVHLHVLVARTDLATGRSFNPARPGWERDYDPVRDLHNEVNGWGRPDDLSRARVAPPGGAVAAMRAAAGEQVAAGWADELREQLTRWAVGQARAGRAGDREQLLEALRGAGWEVARAAKASATVVVDGRRVRLTGSVWSRDWPQGGPAGDQDPAAAAGRAERLRGEVDAAVQRRAEYETGRRRARRQQQRVPDDDAGRLEQEPVAAGAQQDDPAAAPGGPSQGAAGVAAGQADNEQEEAPDDDRGPAQADGCVERAERSGGGLDRAARRADAVLADAAAAGDRALGRADRAGGGLDRAVGGAVAADAGLDRGRARLGRACGRLAAAARRAWAYLTGWATAYPPDEPAARWTRPAAAPGIPDYLTDDGAAQYRSWEQGRPGLDGGGMTR